MKTLTPAGMKIVRHMQDSWMLRSGISGCWMEKGGRSRNVHKMTVRMLLKRGLIARQPTLDVGTIATFVLVPNVDELLRVRGQFFYVDLLTPGTRTVLLEFEKAVRAYAKTVRDGGEHVEYVRAKRAIVRRLRRLEGSLPPDPRGRKSKECNARVLDHVGEFQQEM